MVRKKGIQRDASTCKGRVGKRRCKVIVRKTKYCLFHRRAK